jgi:hypothetical protein
MISKNAAYNQGVVAAMEKFALVRGGGVMRAAQGNMPKGVPLTVRPDARAHRGPAPAAPPGAAPGAPAAGAAKPGMLGRAWNGLNAIAANPVGQMGLMMGVPMAIDAATRRDPNQQ